MGRIKNKTPHQRTQRQDGNNNNDNENNLLLGRYALLRMNNNNSDITTATTTNNSNNNNNFLTAIMLAEEVCVPDAQDIQDELLSSLLQDSSDDDDNDDDATRTAKKRRHKPKKRLQQKLRHKPNKKTKTKYRNNKQNNKQSNNNNNNKQSNIQKGVSFADEQHNPLTCVIPPPQVQIVVVANDDDVNMDDDDDDDEQQQNQQQQQQQQQEQQQEAAAEMMQQQPVIQLIYHGRPLLLVPNDNDEEEEDRMILLKRFSIPKQVQVVIVAPPAAAAEAVADKNVDDDDDDDNIEDNDGTNTPTRSSNHRRRHCCCCCHRYAITSQHGVQDILKFVIVHHSEDYPAKDKQDNDDDDDHHHHHYYYSWLCLMQSMMTMAITKHKTMAMDLCYYCDCNCNDDNNNNNDNDNNKNDNNNSNPSNWYIEFRLLPTAFAISHQQGILSQQQQQQPQRSSPAQTLQCALAWLFPDSLLQDTVRMPSSLSSSSSSSSNRPVVVTAKQVYALTDNVQLQQQLQLQENATKKPFRKIPGLVPTLRPYQECAVQWMLEREQATTAAAATALCRQNNNNNEEWKLAWVVIHTTTPTAATATTILASTTESSCAAAAAAAGNTKKDLVKQQQPISLIHWNEPTNNDITSSTNSSNNNNNNILLICPFTGWLARSVEEARVLTLGATALQTTKGGILAESMGLGKSVEVLACILAHRRPSITTTTTAANANNATTETTRPSAKRKLEFMLVDDDDDDDDDETPNVVSRTTSSVTEKGEPSMIGVVQDNISDFGDAETDDDDGDGSGKYGVSRPSTTCSMPMTPSKSSRTAAVPVTPDEKMEPIEERWMDDDVIGSCICSSLIGFSTRKNDQPVVLCSSCDEPMHQYCAAFASETELLRETKPVRLRQRFSNRTVECRLCDSSRCPCCAASYQNPIESSATLIITPAAILNQWIREIRRHTTTPEGKPLNVVVYEGMNRLCRSSSKKMENFKYMHPRHLANADIVLMTFDALMADLGHSDDNKFIAASSERNSEGSLRSRKRYRVVPSPLLSIRWWRVALDEAQRVETPTAASARMALKLHADHRWCVSGTPVSRGKLEDLYGLLLFLRLEPFTNKQWFKKCFNPAYRDVSERISHLLRHVFWRSTKALDSVRIQMGVPEQIEKKVILNFSSIEKHFYKRQLEQTLATAGEVAERSKSGRKRKASQLNMLAEHIHRLRAACCHPQVGSSGIGQAKRRKIGANKRADPSETGLGSRVMSMEQILDRFIDDAKQKCEEAQRLAILHSNGMAAVLKLKVEAKDRGVAIAESDVCLLRQSCKLYKESLSIGEENACPTLTIGEATISGSVGFRSSYRKIRSGRCVCDWKFNSYPQQTNIWSKIDFESTGRKLTQIQVRPKCLAPKQVTDDTSDRFYWHVLIPKELVLQVSSSTAGGEFVDVANVVIPVPSGQDLQWIREGGFRTKKSKSWRVVVKSFHKQNPLGENLEECYEAVGFYVGLEVELYEADIAYDPLQRLHCLHNASLSFRSLLDLSASGNDQLSASERIDLETECKSMVAEIEEIESLYIDAARAVHNECHRRFGEALRARTDLEHDLFRLTRADKSRNAPKDAWDDLWWDDFLIMVRLHGNENQQRQLCERIYQDLDGFLSGSIAKSSDQNGIIPFPEFGDINGLRTALNMRIGSIRDGLGGRKNRSSKSALRALAAEPSDATGDGAALGDSRALSFRCPVAGHAKTMKAIHALSVSPSSSEKFENRHCQVCKADWHQVGPECRHCKIGADLEELPPDRVTVLLLTAIHSMLRGSFGSAILKKSAADATHVVERAKTFFELLQAEKRERIFAWRLWRAHLDLLNDFDELNQCKSTMRLSYENEDLTQVPEEQLNAIVVPMDVSTRYHDHAAKQAMALGDLRRAKETLRYLKNQSNEVATQKSDTAHANDEGDHCVVCLSSFGDSERAVLRCGHSFHMSPCLEGLRGAGSGGRAWINCPMRCRIRTESQNVMIATHKRRDDGSRSRRAVKGSWGTKVTRLVADVLDIRDLGEKGVVFSQWEDMLDIVQLALTENNLSFVRATSLRQIGTCTERFFGDKDCTLLLLNVKNGAEGLTLLEAQHVFMVEPLLNCGLDSQAVARVHRIGQNKKTYVHRYLIEGTIEVKIDRLREEHQAEDQQIEDAIVKSKKSAIRAGGIDGGFQSQEELLEVLQS